MKKVVVFLALVVLAIYFFSGDLGDISGSLVYNLDNEITSIVKDEGDISVYFCPGEDCESALVAFLDTAEESIHCAMFEIDLDGVRNKLMEKSSEIEVQVVTDNDYLYEFNKSFVKIDSWGLMHNKFCVVDGKRISTGSMNPTVNGATKNNNNLLLINSEKLSDNYEAEFQEMWTDNIYKKGDEVNNPNILLGDVELENYFCPDDECAYNVKEALEKANESIYFMTFSFTHEDIANMMLLRKLDGVKVQGVMEARQVTKYSTYEKLVNNDVEVLKDGNKQNMHHKVFIIDENTVITGSFNPTNGGDTRNDENVLIIHDKSIAEKFMREYESVYAAAYAKLEE